MICSDDGIDAMAVDEDGFMEYNSKHNGRIQGKKTATQAKEKGNKGNKR
jgi:hypothetical protein